METLVSHVWITVPINSVTYMMSIHVYHHIMLGLLVYQPCYMTDKV